MDNLLVIRFLFMNGFLNINLLENRINVIKIVIEVLYYITLCYIYFYWLLLP